MFLCTPRSQYAPYSSRRRASESRSNGNFENKKTAAYALFTAIKWVAFKLDLSLTVYRDTGVNSTSSMRKKIIKLIVRLPNNR